MTINEQLRELPAKGTIFLGIKAPNTADNEVVFAAFKDFSRRYCGDDRAVALRKLLEYYDEDAKFEQLYRYASSLEERIVLLEEKKSPVVKGSGVF